MVRLASDMMPARETAQAVLSGQADLGPCLSPAPIPGLAARTLPGPHMILVAPEGHPLLRRRRVRPADIMPYPLVSYGSDTYFGQVLDQAFAGAGLAREVTLHVTMSMSALSHVRAGAGVAIVDGFIRPVGLPGLGLGWRTFDPPIMLPVTSMMPETGGVPQLAHAFIQVLSAELEEMAA